MSEYVLMHHGVKGMKWGVRKKYLNANGSLNERGVKKYAKKAYSKEAMSDTRVGRMWDRYTGAHKIIGDSMYKTSSAKKNRAAAEKYLNEKATSKKPITAKQTKKAVAKGASKLAEISAKVGVAYMSDQIFWGGAGTRLAKAAVKNAGRMVITGVEMARGGYDIHWYDN